MTKLVHEGCLEQRGAGTTAVASLGRESVHRVAQERAAEAAEWAARTAARQGGPPDAEHEWIHAPAAAEMLGVGSSAARWMARTEAVPAVWRGGRWWFRRDLVLLVANARAARGLQA